MSLLGRLEDLSLTDIVQIVFLSRRTGVLEIVDDRGRHTVLFRQGLVINASSPSHPDLVSFLVAQSLIPAEMATTLRQMEESGIPAGTAALELNLLTPDELAAGVRNRIVGVVAPLMQSREGEFNFILSESVGSLDAEYDPESVFKEGGLAPQKVLGAADGEKIKPLQGLEDSLRAGKALLRGSGVAEPAPASLNLGLGQPAAPPYSSSGEMRMPEPAELPAAESAAAPEGWPEPAETDDPLQLDQSGAAESGSDNVVPFRGGRDAEPPPFADVEEELAASSIGPLTPNDEAAQALGPQTDEPVRTPSTGRFKVAGGLFEVESPGVSFRNVVVFERNPLVRVAAKRAFTKQGVKISQFGALDDVRNAMTELFRSNAFFVTFLELDAEEQSARLLQQIKRRNPRLPVVVIDAEADLRRRHEMLRAGADLYLTKPSAARLQPGLAEEELALFADELVLFAERAFGTWQHFAGTAHDGEAGKRFYESAEKENIDRSFAVLKQLINELSNPNDIGQVADTILRLSGQYLERGALFMAADSEFVGLGGFGVTGGANDMDARVKKIRLPRNEASLLGDVASRGEAHRGKMKRTPANVHLIERLGGMLPTEVVALPIMHSERTIGILYGDNAEHRAPIDTMTGLEIFLSQAGFAFRNAVFASGRTERR